MQTLSQFIACLPGVRPVKARRLILEGGLLSANERADIYGRHASILDTVLQVGPDAAGAILAAYKNGQLPMERGQAPVAAPEAEAYLERGQELRKSIAERKRRELAVTDPSLIVESDFSNHQLMNSVFFASIGSGSGSMVLAGITVRKIVIPYKTNSGQRTDWGVRFDWVGSDGQHRNSEFIPSTAYNRRNDADRNWGLPE